MMSLYNIKYPLQNYNGKIIYKLWLHITCWFHLLVAGIFFHSSWFHFRSVAGYHSFGKGRWHNPDKKIRVSREHSISLFNLIDLGQTVIPRSRKLVIYIQLYNMFSFRNKYRNLILWKRKKKKKGELGKVV